MNVILSQKAIYLLLFLSYISKIVLLFIGTLLLKTINDKNTKRIFAGVTIILSEWKTKTR